MTRLEDLTDDRLVELLAHEALDHDPASEFVSVRRVEVLAELARRVLQGRDDQPMTVPEARRRRKRIREEAERHHTGP